MIDYSFAIGLAVRLRRLDAPYRDESGGAEMKKRRVRQVFADAHNSKPQDNRL
jgi:hypothetical protein